MTGCKMASIASSFSVPASDWTSDRFPFLLPDSPGSQVMNLRCLSGCMIAYHNLAKNTSVDVWIFSRCSKLENRATRKISRKQIFRRLHCCKAL